MPAPTLRPNPLIPSGAARVIDRFLTRQRTEVCTIQRPVAGVDASGAPIGGFGTVDVASCQVRPVTRLAAEGIGGARFGVVVDYVVSFWREVDVRSEDRILVNGTEHTLLVTADSDAASFGFETRVSAKTVES